MKKILTIMSLVVLCLAASAQQTNVLDQLKSDPRKSYGSSPTIRIYWTQL